MLEKREKKFPYALVGLSSSSSAVCREACGLEHLMEI